MLYAKSHDGLLRAAHAGALLDWLSPEQREHFLRLRLVEEIAEADPQPTPPDAVQPTPDAADPHDDIVDHCIATLELLMVPATAGAPTARTALRGNDYKYANHVIAGAVRRRKELCGAVPDDEDEL